MSSKDPVERKSELKGIGVSEPFELEYKALVENNESVEREVHLILDDHKPNKSREFFTCSMQDAVTVIRANYATLYEEKNYAGFGES